MHFEENEITESSKPTKGAKIILGFCFGLGLIITGLMTFGIIFSLIDLWDIMHGGPRVLKDIILSFSYFFASLFITIGSFKMWHAMEKGWAALFFGSSVFFFLLLMILSQTLQNFLSVSPVTQMSFALFYILSFVIFSFFGFVSIWLLSPGMRKFPSQKKMFLSFALTGLVCFLLIASHFLQKYF